MEKTVYILGAGFSKEANAPSQEELVRRIFEIADSNPHEFENNSIEKFKNFLEETLNIPESMQCDIPLEDIFTPLDRCIADNISFRNLNSKEALNIRELIYYLIGKTIEVELRTSNKEYIDKFAEHVTNLSSERMHWYYSKVDPVSVISTNWDILLDNSVKNFIRNEYPNDGVVDYCCQISSFEINDDTVKPGLEKLALGGFNVKLLKVHGSLNWLQCPRCLRVYVDFYDKIAIRQYTDPTRCRHCNNNFGNYESHTLISNLIMPTFLKNLASAQYKLIWQNTGIELAEASKIVFIGYSLPFADFEMRQLLSRMVRENVNIEVVDYGNKSDTKIIDLIRRYTTFFGGRDIEFFLNGASHYIENNLGN